jgi:hypothetical protein
MGPLAEWRKEREERLAVKAVRAYCIYAYCIWRMALGWGRGGGEGGEARGRPATLA